ncbi:3-deoxy-manno-octulosonate cytidylyltransferase [Cecembia sp.]|uniref:3-deoxy-manno-octulosonate cytidylyltransferase n=1 Tax=Cecembia sp. TaxID=1898110 RepID=UPI0025BB7774|nr:3-deoxy-manno-octulosonate cytidylyltransferase [Cecembia sp.]
MTSAVAVIPARLGSTRFPRKVLASETGSPMVRHVWEAATAAERIERVVVATDAQEVVDAVEAFGAEAVMTSPDHPNGTSRIAETASKLGLDNDAIVVNVQGDEPEIEPGAIDALVGAIAQGQCPSATVAGPFAQGEDFADPNKVKVVLNGRGEAVYFSRSVIPFARSGEYPAGHEPLKHAGLYAYRRWLLDAYLDMAPTALESIEQLEQLRLVYHGVPMAVAIYQTRSSGIDTPEQYASFVRRFRSREG